MKETRAFLGIGSNQGDRLSYLLDAIAAIPDLEMVSPIYETEPLDCPFDQQPYLNAVAELWTCLSPRALLELGRSIEERAMRIRTVRNGPRTIDVDVLLVGDQVVSEADLIIPHPRMWERRFVLEPMSVIAPDLVDSDLLNCSRGSVRVVGVLSRNLFRSREPRQASGCSQPYGH